MPTRALLAVLAALTSTACTTLGELETSNTVSATVTFVRSDTGATNPVSVDVPCVVWKGPEFQASAHGGGDGTFGGSSVSGRMSSDGSRLLELSLGSSWGGATSCSSHSIQLKSLSLETKGSDLPLVFSGSLDVGQQLVEATERSNPTCVFAPIPMAGPATVTVTFSREDVSYYGCQDGSARY